MPAMKFHRRAILRGKPLQSCRRTGIDRPIRPAIGMQHRDPASIGLLELREFAARVQSQLAVEVEKIGLVRHRHPLHRGVATWLEACVPLALRKGSSAPTLFGLAVHTALTSSLTRREADHNIEPT